jgi:transcriptional regulator of acetoin/glycerol metabolism
MNTKSMRKTLRSLRLSSYKIGMGVDAETRDLVSQQQPAAAAVPGVIAVFSAGQPLFAPIPLVDGKAELGRDDERGITDDKVSRRHAIVSLERGAWQVTDVDSRNGTFVNGARVTGTAPLPAPRVLRLAYTLYVAVDDLRPYLGAQMDADGERVVGPVFAAALAQVRRVGNETVLLTGESGVGKELAARELHVAGGGGPFVSVNAAAIPEGLAERLLLGSVRGAFSGATDAEGYIASADGGLLFLDEIGELDPAVQPKLLRVLETREVVPLGASRGRRVTTRFCFATFRNLRDAMAANEFRPDLFYRIAHTEVRLPPLRERREEIPWLIAIELGADRTAHARFVEACMLREWPGNVRGLRSAVRAAARDGGKPVRPEDLDETVGTRTSSAQPASKQPLEITREQLERALAEAGGNRSAAARALGLHRSQLYRLLEHYGLATS